LGDDKYGDFALNRTLHREAGVRRLFLHAHRLALSHPISAEPMTVVAALPKDMQSFCESHFDAHV
jgi:23S rRNA pseudouridine955/2504/2580 synthase